MSKLKVGFDNLHAGWVTLNICKGEEAITIHASYVYASFHLLTNALYKLVLSEGQAVATWNTEPTEYELWFTREGETITLDILRFSDSRRTIFQRNIVMSITGTYEEICLPFWRALRNLQGCYSEAEIEERWHSSFPTREITILTRALGK